MRPRRTRESQSLGMIVNLTFLLGTAITLSLFAFMYFLYVPYVGKLSAAHRDGFQRRQVFLHGTGTAKPVQAEKVNPTSQEKDDKKTGRKLFGDLGTPSYRVLYGSDQGLRDKSTCRVALGILAGPKRISELPHLVRNVSQYALAREDISIVVHLSTEAAKEGKVVENLLKQKRIVTVLEHEQGASRADSERLSYLHLLDTLQMNNCSYYFVFRNALQSSERFLDKVLDFLAQFEDRKDWGYLSFVSSIRKASMAYDLSQQDILEDNSAPLSAVLYPASLVPIVLRILQSSNKGLFVDQMVQSEVVGNLKLKVFERTPNLFQQIAIEPGPATMRLAKETDPRENWFSASFEMNEEQFSFHSLTPSTPEGYLGCYGDQLGHENRDLTGLVEYRALHSSVNKCRQFCIQFAYFGLQNGQECFCSNEFGRYGNASDSDCNTPCLLDSTSVCGGALKNSVYRTLPYRGKFVNCLDRKVLEQLPGLPKVAETIDDCASKCNSHQYFGLTKGRICYCFENLKLVDLESLMLNTSHCNVRCHGDTTQICGGRTSVAIFSTVYY